MEFNDLIQKLLQINEGLREQSLRAVNTSLTMRNWFFGFYIFEFEQNGQDRAEYGKALLFNISLRMKQVAIPNTDERELRRYRQFYMTYPSISRIFGSIGTIRGLLPPELELELLQETNTEIRELENPELNIPLAHYQNLIYRISYTHFVELIRIDEPLKRLFYEIEAIKGTWSVKELKRQIGSLLFERTALSKNKNKLLSFVNSDTPALAFPDLIRDPYIFEFLGLKQKEVLFETELEQLLLDHLQEFLLELGKGFCFEARQKRILIDGEFCYIDLVFYHRTLHCNVLIDLKMERFHHSHASQLNAYLEYYKKYELADGDQPPVGILLCSDKDKEHVEFATAGIEQKVFVSQYLVGLPDKKELEQFIKNEIEKFER
jgi:predicted nuclease of restriction endonuclease-like (RecB) superfamily